MKKKIVITGAGSGLGKMAALELARRGHKVYATTQYLKQAKELNTIAKENNFDLSAFKLDILIEKDRKKINDIEFDTLICNAAIGDSGSVSEANIDRFRKTFETNVFSNIELTQLVLNKFINKKYGRIIFISSLVGKVSLPFLSPYSTTKFAVEGFVSALMYEMKILNKLKNINIEICMIEPGSFATGFNEDTNAKKYIWMNENSYFFPKISLIKKYEDIFLKLTETRKFDKIIKQYVRAVEDKKIKFRYTAPKLQSFFIKLALLFM